MENLNIFDEVKQGQFFKFEKVGDAVQGTYIGKSRAMGKFGEQVLYILQDKEGNVWNVPFGLTKTIVHDKMDGVKFGQIIGFKFDESRPNDKGNDAKIIRVYENPKFIDRAWLSSQKELGIDINSNVVQPLRGSESPKESAEPGSIFGNDPFVVPSEAGPAGGSLPKDEINVKEVDMGKPAEPKNEALDAIRNLAKTKGLTSEEMPEVEADTVIEQYAGLPLKEENLTKIIIKLTGYVKQ